MTLLALIAAALIGALVMLCGLFVMRDSEIASIAASRIALARQWRLLAQIWKALDATTRTHVRLNAPQRLALWVALHKADGKVS